MNHLQDIFVKILETNEIKKWLLMLSGAIKIGG